MMLSLLIPVLLLASQSESTDLLPRRGQLGVGFTPLTSKQAEEHGLARGEGLVAGTPTPELTAEKLGLQNGDRVLRLNGEVVSSSMIQGALRSLPAGSALSLEVVRKGQVLKLNGPLLERPRDPGTANYEVIYSHIVHAGQRMRTIITRPRSPGKHPGFFFIQGFSPVSYDFTLSTATGDVASLDGPLLHKFAESGFATMRVEKPGVGDSEGGPFAELDYQQEIGIYREALLQLKRQSFVDPEDVFVFGHSMGGSFGPMVVADEPVRGIAVFGTAARTWFEYLLDTIRYQGLVAGDNFVNTDE
jgi:hypothetical protein